MKRIKRLCESSNGSGRLSRPADLLFTLFPVARTYVKFRESRSSDSCESFSDRYSESRLPVERRQHVKIIITRLDEREKVREKEGRREDGNGRWKVETKKGTRRNGFTLPVAPHIVPYLSGFGDPIGKAL